jgi:beta-galactosidase
MRTIESIDFDWRFMIGDDPSWASPSFDDSAWTLVDLPHDWSIQGPFSKDNPAGGSNAWAPTGVAWYRRPVSVPGAAAGLLSRLEFDGIYHNATIYLDGEVIGRHVYGFTSFTVDLGPRLAAKRAGLVAVRVDNSDVPNCRWYTGSGINRRARIVSYSALHFEPWGLTVRTTKLSRRRAYLSISAEIRNESPVNRSFVLDAKIIGPGGDEVDRITHKAQIPAEKGGETTMEARIVSPRLWSTDDPRLYSVEARILEDGCEVDRLDASFGLRTAEFRPGRGFFLNGRATKLKGVCLHEDAGCVGTAVPPAVWKRRLGVLKEIGCNAVRCAHNPPDPQFLDLCDRLGFLVIDELFDKWEGASYPQPDQWFMRQAGFKDFWEAELEAAIKRDRNHPSIILWSVGNETGQPGSEEVDNWLGELTDRARRLDPTRSVTAAIVGSDAAEIDEKARRVMKTAAKIDVLSVNYQEALFAHYHAADPKKIIIASEAFLHWRGIGSLVHAFWPRNPWFDVVENRFVAGQFLWPGIDYLGESWYWPLKGWYTGLLDTTGRLKPTGQFHRSVWSKRPMVAIAIRDHGLGKGEDALSWGGYSLSAHWNWPEWERKKIWPEVGGRLVEVEVQTNCETVELILNGRSYGEKKASEFVNAAVLFLVPYQPGRLVAVGRNGGVEAAHDAVETAGPPAALRISTDRDAIAADGYDVAHITVELIDDRGLRVPRQDRVLSFKLEGPGRILGLDNGSLASEEEYVGSERATAEGRCLAIVGRCRTAGTMQLCVAARLDDGSAVQGTISIAAR